MAYYRIYSLDPTDQHIIDFHHFEADSDAAAISKVGSAVLGVPRELWNLGRKVMDSRSEGAVSIAIGTSVEV